MLLATATAEDEVVCVLVVELGVELLVVEDELAIEVLELLEDELLELVVLLVGEYTKVVVPLALPPGPPHVALIVNVPLVHAAIPPGTDV